MNYDPYEIEEIVKDVFHNVNGLQSIIEVNPLDVSKYLELININLSSYYIQRHGTNWQKDKLQEMKESGLIYVAVYQQSKMIGFISFVNTIDDQSHVLYLYEIHIIPQNQSSGLGSCLLDKFHLLPKLINNKTKDPIKGTKLTVFPDNKSLGWYFHKGYSISEDSPRDKKLRNKLIKPEYYLLYRPIS